jgi:hypothetical protein
MKNTAPAGRGSEKTVGNRAATPRSGPETVNDGR